MDLTSVVKADRDVSVSRDVAVAASSVSSQSVKDTKSGATSAAPVVPAVTSSAAAKSSSSHGSSKGDKPSAIANLLKKNVWEQEPYSAKASIKDSTLAEESTFSSDLSLRREIASEEKKQEELKEQLEKAKEVIESLNLKNLSISFGTSEKFEESHVINVVDSESKEVIRQIPSDEFLRVSYAIKEYEERLAQSKLVQDPALKAAGVDSAGVNDALRGTVLDDMA